MNKLLLSKTFHDADQKIVAYQGQTLSWRVSVYAVVIKDSQILIAKDSTEKLHDIPGGGIEFGETIAEALERETLEETGAIIKVNHLIDINMDWFYHNKLESYHQALQLFYAAELKGELAQPSEPTIEWVGFVPVAEIGKRYHLPPQAEAIIADYLSA